MACVDSVSRSPQDNTAALNSQKAPSFAAELQAAQLRVSQSQTADITIVTREGDTVTLSSSKSAELSFATYSALGQAGKASASLSGMTAELQRSTSLSISFAGDLNKEELMDIRRALQTFQKAAHDVLTGHAEKAASRTAKLAKLDQISSIEADLIFNREVSRTQASAKSKSAPNTESALGTATTETDSRHVSVLIQIESREISASGLDSATPVSA